MKRYSQELSDDDSGHPEKINRRPGAPINSPWLRRLQLAPLGHDDFVVPGCLVANITDAKAMERKWPTLGFEMSRTPQQDRCLRVVWRYPTTEAPSGDDDDGPSSPVTNRGSSQPFFWYRVEKGWYGCYYLRQDCPAGRIMFHIKSVLLEDYKEFLMQESLEADSHKSNYPLSPFYQYWSPRFANFLSSESDCTPLSEGLWHLTPHTWQHKLVERIFQTQQSTFSHGYASFDPPSIPAFALRKWSHRKAGRVKWWRKQAIAGCLPPVLVWWFSGLNSYLILDGHDRLVAAHLERCDVDVIALSRKGTNYQENHHWLTPKQAAIIQEDAENMLLFVEARCVDARSETTKSQGTARETTTATKCR